MTRRIVWSESARHQYVQIADYLTRAVSESFAEKWSEGIASRVEQIRLA